VFESQGGCVPHAFQIECRRDDTLRQCIIFAAIQSAQVHGSRYKLADIFEPGRSNMNRFLIAAAALTLLTTPGFAQDNDHRDEHHGDTMMMNHRDDHPNSMMMQAHHDWHKGDHIGRDDWGRSERIADYHQYHLSRPPHGYEWRRVDNNFVLAAAAGGLIAAVIAAGH
jgi:Ni/Co efflux regulator RcnB